MKMRAYLSAFILCSLISKANSNDLLLLTFKYDKGQVTLLSQESVDSKGNGQPRKQELSGSKWLVKGLDSGGKDVTNVVIDNPQILFYDIFIDSGPEKGQMTGGMKELDVFVIHVLIPDDNKSKKIKKFHFMKPELDEKHDFKNWKKFSEKNVTIK